MNNILQVTFSIGISIYPDDGNHADILLRNSDTAMYKAKNMGKNTFELYNKQMTEDILEKIDLEKDIKFAIDNGQFIPYLQPQVNALTNELTGVEALVRWRNDELGIISPDNFLPLAENTGLIVDIGRLMIINTIKIFQKHSIKDSFHGTLSINVSVKQLEYPNFMTELEQILKDTGFDPKLIEFEITESQIMANPQKTTRILNSIKSFGIKISIDDFGTGYSSLSYLSTLPIDKLKIDKSFIDDIHQNEDSVIIVKTIVALAKSLNLEVIAEGVETDEQKDILLGIGCHHIQGFLYSKPLSEEDFKNYSLLK